MGGINLAPAESRIDRIVAALRQMMQGRDNACGVVTLTAGATTTTVPAPNCASDSKVFISPATAYAAAEIGNGTLYVSAVANEQFTIAHANDATTDRTFFWTVRG